MVRRTLFQSLRSFKDFTEYLEEKYTISLEPTTSRWGIVSTSATIFFSFIAFGIGVFAVWLTLFYDGGKMMTVGLWVLAIFAGLIVLAGFCGVVMVGILMVYWKKHPYESATDILIRGIIRGALEEGIPKEEVAKKIENLGIRIGEKANKLTADGRKGQVTQPRGHQPQSRRIPSGLPTKEVKRSRKV